MAKASKSTKKERASEYEKKTPVKGNFLEIMQAATKDANKKSAPKKKN